MGTRTVALIRSSVLRRGVRLAAAALLATIPLHAAVLITDLDGDGWDAYDANLGAPWTSVLDDVNSDVWGSGGPVSGRGVAFSGPPTLGQSGLFDDHIAESSDLAADLGLLSADWIHFDFYQVALTYSPNALSVFVRDHESHDWYLNIAPPALAGWSSYTVSLAPAAGWYSPTGGISFADALSGGPTQQMGIRLQYEAGFDLEQQYGLADFHVTGDEPVNVYAVPEPASGVFSLLGALVVWAAKRWRQLRAARAELAAAMAGFFASGASPCAATTSGHPGSGAGGPGRRKERCGFSLVPDEILMNRAEWADLYHPTPIRRSRD